MGMRAPMATGTGGTIPIVGMPSKSAGKRKSEGGVGDNSDTYGNTC